MCMFIQSYSYIAAAEVMHAKLSASLSIALLINAACAMVLRRRSRNPRPRPQTFGKLRSSFVCPKWRLS